MNLDAAGVVTSGSKILPLSSSTANEGDSSIRIMERLEANLEPVSMLRQINARWSATCGDGTNSFGDFNGTDAIQQAITFYNTHIGLGAGLTLLLKRGNFYVNPTNGAISIPGGIVTIQGEGPNNTNIIMDVLVSPAIDAATDGTDLILRDLTVVGELLDAQVRIQSECSLEAQDVMFARTGILASNAQSVRVIRCRMANNSLASPSVSLVSGILVTSGPFTFTDCEILSAQNQPVLFVQSGSATLSIIEQIRFTRCRMTLLDATVASGNLVGNSGVIDVDPNGHDSLNGTAGARIAHIGWIDCDVTGPETGTAAILMHLIPVANGSATAADPYDSSIDPAMAIQNVVIRGGHWMMKRLETTINPFTIGLAVSISNTYQRPWGRVTIKDWLFEIDELGGTLGHNGGPTEDVESFFTTSDTTDRSGPPVMADWGAVAISAMDLVMKDCEIVGVTQAGNSGDLFLKVDRYGDIDNIKIYDHFSGGTGSIPNQRIRTRFGDSFAIAQGFPDISMKRVVIIGHSSPTEWCNLAIWQHEPSETPVLIKDCAIFGFRVSGGNHGRSNFTLVDAAANTLWGSVNGNTGTVYRLTLDGFKSSGGLTGMDFVRSVGGFKGLTIKGCALHDNTSKGLDMTESTSGIGVVNLSNNVIENNGDYGVQVSVNNWLSSDVSSLIMMGNHIYDNSGSASGIQVYIESSNSGSQDPIGAVHGNNLGPSGQLKINRAVTGTKTAFLSPDDSITPFRGVETGYEGETSAGKNKVRHFDSTDAMFHNVGIL
ncbi:hypothetical protein LCGC14_1957460, partial [marine sediment metagenome]